MLSLNTVKHTRNPPSAKSPNCGGASPRIVGAQDESYGNFVSLVNLCQCFIDCLTNLFASLERALYSLHVIIELTE